MSAALATVVGECCAWCTCDYHHMMVVPGALLHDAVVQWMLGRVFSCSYGALQLRESSLAFDPCNSALQFCTIFRLVARLKAVTHLTAAPDISARDARLWQYLVSIVASMFCRCSAVYQLASTAAHGLDSGKRVITLPEGS